MSKKGDRKTPKNPALPTEQLTQGHGTFFDAVNHENDLACVVLVTSYLEKCLELVSKPT
jgi:hypothetical protein